MSMSYNQECKSKIIWTLNLNKNRSYIPLPKNDCIVYSFRVKNLIYTGNPFTNSSILHVSCPQLCEKTSEGSGFHVKPYYSPEDVFCGSPIIANYELEGGKFKYYPQIQPKFKFEPIRLCYILISLEDENGTTFNISENDGIKIVLELLTLN